MQKRDVNIVERLLRWANTIQSITRTGLGFTSNLHDRLRYQELQEIAEEMLASVNRSLKLDEDFADELAEILRRDVRSGVTGYVTPKVSVAAAVFDKNDQLLLVKNSHSNAWTLPGGWAEERWTPAENAQREVLEETGLAVKSRNLLGVFDSRLHPFGTTVTGYTLLFECQLINGELQALYGEIEDACFYSKDMLPPLITGAKEQIRVAFAFHKGSLEQPFFDSQSTS